MERAEPHKLVLRAGRSGPIGGKIDILTSLTLTDEAEGTQLNYESNAELSGPVAAANNPLFVGMAKHGLKTFFKKLDARLSSGLSAASTS